MAILGKGFLTVVALTTLGLVPVDAMSEGGKSPERTLTLSVLGRYHSGLFDQGGAEIVAYDPETQRLFVINAAEATVDVLDIRNPSAPVKIETIDASSLGTGANSIDVRNGLVAVAIEAADPQENGLVAFYDAENLLLLKTVPVGALPDMLTFTEDGKKVLVANEGQPNDEYTVDPEGSVSIIDLSRGVMNATVATVYFQDWNDRKEELIAAGVRIFGPNATVAQDLEPEYITVSDDGKRAWVTLQENNALGVIDVRRAKVIDILPLGFKDHSLPGNELDASDRDGRIQIRNWPILGMYQPDGIDDYRFRGETYLVTMNEGDARDYDGFGEEERIGGLDLDPVVFPNSDELQGNANLGRLRVTNALGDADGDGDFDQLFSYGARSFSIWDTRGNLVYDSGADLEKKIAERLPEQFNSDHVENDSFDTRSDDKGPEPEGVVIGKVRGRTYAFIALERISGIIVYDITNPFRVSFVTYLNPRDFTVETCFDTNGDGDCDATNPAVGDLGPEGVAFIPADESPIGKPLLAVGNEVGGTTTLLQIEVRFNSESHKLPDE